MPPGNYRESVNFDDTELGEHISKEALHESIEDNASRFDLGDRKSISKFQHKLHEDEFYVHCDSFLEAVQNDQPKEEIIEILEELKESFPETTFTRDKVRERFEYFVALAEELVWKKNRYDISEELLSAFEHIQKLIGNCRFHDTVKGDSSAEVKESTKRKSGELEKETDDALNNLHEELKFYTKVDEKRTQKRAA